MRPRRIRIAILAGTVLVLTAANASAGISVKLTGGMNYLLQGDYGRSLRGAYDALVAETGGVEGAFKPFRTDLRGGIEIIIPAGESFEIGLGACYERLSLDNRFRYFWLFVTLEEAVESRMTVVPITLNVHTSIPLGRRLGLDLFGGPGYYLVEFSHGQSLATDFFAFADSRTFTARKGTLGIQGGASLEWALGSGLALVLQADGRFVRLGELKGELKDTTSWFLGQTAEPKQEASFWAYDGVIGTRTFPLGAFAASEPADPTATNVRPAGLDLSGFGLSAGLRLRF